MCCSHLPPMMTSPVHGTQQWACELSICLVYIADNGEGGEHALNPEVGQGDSKPNAARCLGAVWGREGEGRIISSR